jgi:hypothetical protein
MEYNVKFNQITLGTDPEWFAGMTVKGIPQVIPAAYFEYELKMPHIEDPRHPKFYKRDGIVIHRDGVAFELTVPAVPNGNWKKLLNYAHFGLEKLQNLLKPYSDVCDGVYVLPTILYDHKRWNACGDYMVDSNMFGCDRDWNAFQIEEKAVVIDAYTWPKRYGGGHMHMSGHPLMKEDPVLAVKCAAMTVGATASALSPHPKEEKDRTFLYGKIGKFRPQNYPDGSVGIEYRTPSNTWTDPNNYSMAQSLFESLEFCIEKLMNFPAKAQKLADELEEGLTEAIAQCNQPLARDILQYVKDEA